LGAEEEEEAAGWTGEETTGVEVAEDTSFLTCVFTV